MSSESILFVCPNPHCSSRRTSFATEKALTMHCQKSPPCVAYLRHDRTKTDPSALTGHKRNNSAMLNPRISSTKSATVLRCEMQNNNDYSGTAIEEMLLSDDDDFVFEENEDLDDCDGLSIAAQDPSQSLPF